jgi:chromosome segregation ATPase
MNSFTIEDRDDFLTFLPDRDHPGRLVVWCSLAGESSRAVVMPVEEIDALIAYLENLPGRPAPYTDAPDFEEVAEPEQWRERLAGVENRVIELQRIARDHGVAIDLCRWRDLENLVGQVAKSFDMRLRAVEQKATNLGNQASSHGELIDELRANEQGLDLRTLAERLETLEKELHARKGGDEAIDLVVKQHGEKLNECAKRYDLAFTKLGNDLEVIKRKLDVDRINNTVAAWLNDLDGIKGTAGSAHSMASKAQSIAETVKRKLDVDRIDGTVAAWLTDISGKLEALEKEPRQTAGLSTAVAGLLPRVDALERDLGRIQGDWGRTAGKIDTTVELVRRLHSSASPLGVGVQWGAGIDNDPMSAEERMTGGDRNAD